MYDVNNQFQFDKVDKWYGTSDEPEVLELDRDEELPHRMCNHCSTVFRYFKVCASCKTIVCDLCQSYRILTKRRKEGNMKYRGAYCPCGQLLEILY